MTGDRLFQISMLEFIIQFVLLLMLFTWLQISLAYISKILGLLPQSHANRILVYGAYYLSFAITGCIIYPKLCKMHVSKYSLHIWLVLTVVSFLIPILATTTPHIFASVIIAGITLGICAPYCLSYFADRTKTENRGKIGGILFCLMSPTIPVFSFYTKMLDLNFFSIFSTAYTFVGLILLILFKLKTKETDIYSNKKANVPLFTILSDRQFYLYFVAWAIYSIIDNFGASVLNPFLQETFGKAFRDLMLNIGAIIMALSAIIIGFVIDVYGRKRALIYGFVALGMAYAFIGINPLNMAFWCLYFIISGVASGFFIVIFVFTIWGDISPVGMREKYYAVGSLPFFLLVLIREIMAPYTKLVPVSTAFSFASFFLFLAILPLMYAPETLPEREIRRREFRDYIKKAKKIVEKY